MSLVTDKHSRIRAIVVIQGAITVACERSDDINTRQEQLDSKLESITDEVDILTMRTAEIDITQKREVQKLDETKFEVGKISEKKNIQPIDLFVF
jgi:hypothetical protein